MVGMLVSLKIVTRKDAVDLWGLYDHVSLEAMKVGDRQEIDIDTGPCLRFPLAFLAVHVFCEEYVCFADGKYPCITIEKIVSNEVTAKVSLDAVIQQPKQENWVCLKSVRYTNFLENDETTLWNAHLFDPDIVVSGFSNQTILLLFHIASASITPRSKSSHLISGPTIKYPISHPFLTS